MAAGPGAEMSKARSGAGGEEEREEEREEEEGQERWRGAAERQRGEGGAQRQVRLKATERRRDAPGLVVTPGRWGGARKREGSSQNVQCPQ
jgi:hypothetical protein